MFRCSPSLASPSPISWLVRSFRKAHMFGNLGFTEIAILLLILVLFFGAKRIPEIGASIGKGIKEFKKGLKDVSAEEPPATSDSPLPPAAGGSSPKRLNQ